MLKTNFTCNNSTTNLRYIVYHFKRELFFSVSFGKIKQKILAIYFLIQTVYIIMNDPAFARAYAFAYSLTYGSVLSATGKGAFQFWTQCLGPLTYPPQVQERTFHQLLVTSHTAYKLLVTSYQLLFSSYQLLVTSYQLLVTSYQLLVASYQLLVTSHWLLVTSHYLLVTSYQLPVTNYYSRVTCCQ